MTRYKGSTGAPKQSSAVSLIASECQKGLSTPCATLTPASIIDAGVDIVTISKRLGHAKPDITLRIYAHLFRKDDGKAAAKSTQF
ncbi:MAG TPA: hypothetical protein VEI95_14650 [Acidobacteriota bacterium]|nr:hypothetical protein [Acidobacteriota bacterium]